MSGDQPVSHAVNAAPGSVRSQTEAPGHHRRGCHSHPRDGIVPASELRELYAATRGGIEASTSAVGQQG